MLAHVKSPVLFWFSVVLFLIVLGFVGDRTIFLMRSQHAQGTVRQLSAANASCRCGKRCHYACTRFQADVNFTATNVQSSLWVSAGSARGYDCSTDLARYRVGAEVPIIFNTHNPAEAYRDTFNDVWGTPIVVFLFQVFTFVGSFTQRRHSA